MNTTIAAEMSPYLAPGSVIVVLAGETGGNCELTEPGETVVILGKSGTGKSVLLRHIIGLEKPDSGAILIGGEQVEYDAPGKGEHTVAMVFQSSALFNSLTVADNVALYLREHKVFKDDSKVRQIVSSALDIVGLSEKEDVMPSVLSGGMKRRVMIAKALSHEPRILFLDEPTTGLDPRSRLELWETIEGLVADGTTVLLTTQYLDEADRLADRIAVIDHGRVIAEGTGDDLKDRVGGARVEVELTDDATAPAAISALAPMSDEVPTVEEGVVHVTVRHRRGAVVDAVRRLDAAGIAVDDAVVRRPTLDDVFLALTGRAAEPEGDPEDREAEEVAA